MPATLLIVDDEKDIRDMLSSCFRRRGYQVLPAGGGRRPWPWRLGSRT